MNLGAAPATPREEEARPKQWNVQLKALDASPEEDDIPLKSVKVKAVSKRKTSKISASANTNESPAKEPRQRRVRRNV